MQHAPRPRARAPAKPDAEAEKPEKLPQTRPAMPSGTVRARRLVCLSHFHCILSLCSSSSRLILNSSKTNRLTRNCLPS